MKMVHVLFKLLLIHFIVFLLFGWVAAQEQLYVFYPTTARPHVVQEKMQHSFNGVTVTVFGRYNDFLARVSSAPPDALLAKPSLIHTFKGYTVVLNARRSGSTMGTYVLMSINPSLDPTTISTETVIGTLDILGRSGMQHFLKQLFSSTPRLKRVTKIEDLLPLLSFNMADGIVVEDVFVDYFKMASQLQFTVTPLAAAQRGILSLAVANGGNADSTLAAFKHNDNEVCNLFKVDLWE